MWESSEDVRGHLDVYSQIGRIGWMSPYESSTEMSDHIQLNCREAAHICIDFTDSFYSK